VPRVYEQRLTGSSGGMICVVSLGRASSDGCGGGCEPCVSVVFIVGMRRVLLAVVVPV
jgi:hypothetical protein